MMADHSLSVAIHEAGQVGEPAERIAAVSTGAGGRRQAMAASKTGWIRNSFRIRKKRCLIEESTPSPTTPLSAIPLWGSRRNGSMGSCSQRLAPISAKHGLSVRFNDADMTEVIANDAEPIEEDEMASYWYTQNDYMRFEKDRVLTSLAYVTAKQRGNLKLMDEIVHSVRGLENLMDERMRRRRACERRALHRSVEEQQGHIRPEKLREICCKHTKSAREQAQQIGHDDARAVVEKKSSVTTVLREAFKGFRK